MGDIITPTGSGGSEETRKAVSGWKAIQQGKRESRQERIIKEQEERAERIKQGLPAEKENGYRPGEDAPSDEFSLRRMKEATKKLVTKQMQTREFKGTPEQCINKLVLLFNGIEDPSTGKIRNKPNNLQIVEVVEAGFGVYRIKFTHD